MERKPAKGAIIGCDFRLFYYLILVIPVDA